jgi:hypothetical protein
MRRECGWAEVTRAKRMTSGRNGNLPALVAILIDLPAFGVLFVINLTVLAAG